MDDLVEQVIMALDNGKHLENTYIIFSSDNGFHLGNCDKCLPKLTIVLENVLQNGCNYQFVVVVVLLGALVALWLTC